MNFCKILFFPPDFHQSLYYLFSCVIHWWSMSVKIFSILKESLPGCKGVWTVYHKNTRSQMVDSSKMVVDEDEYHAYLIISLETRSMVKWFRFFILLSRNAISCCHYKSILGVAFWFFILTLFSRSISIAFEILLVGLILSCWHLLYNPHFSLTSTHIHMCICWWGSECCQSGLLWVLS